MSPTSLLRGFALLLLLQWICTLIIDWLQIPFPPALLGMIVLSVLLCTKIVNPAEIEGICDLLISKMGMLFLPAGVSVILYADVIRAEFAAITITTIICSLAVLIITALFLEFALKGSSSKEVK